MNDPTPDSTPEPTPPPPGQPAPASGGGLEPNIAAMLSYLLFGWIGGLIMFFTQKHPEVRFHAAQSIIVFGALTVVSVVLSTISWMMPLAISALFSLLGFVLWLGSVALWIVLSIKGYNLEHFKLPIAGDMAEQWAAQQA